MLSTSAQQLNEIGASLGLEGTDLLNFIKEQQKMEREDKDKKKRKTEKRKSTGRTKKEIEH